LSFESFKKYGYGYMRWVWWHMAVFTVVGRLRREDLKFRPA
jgi:hypothetical protein